jgi:hypothetical protein
MTVRMPDGFHQVLALGAVGAPLRGNAQPRSAARPAIASRVPDTWPPVRTTARQNLRCLTGAVGGGSAAAAFAALPAGRSLAPGSGSMVVAAMGSISCPFRVAHEKRASRVPQVAGHWPLVLPTYRTRHLTRDARDDRRAEPPVTNAGFDTEAVQLVPATHCLCPSTDRATRSLRRRPERQPSPIEQRRSAQPPSGASPRAPARMDRRARNTGYRPSSTRTRRAIVRRSAPPARAARARNQAAASRSPAASTSAAPRMPAVQSQSGTGPAFAPAAVHRTPRHTNRYADDDEQQPGCPARNAMPGAHVRSTSCSAH